MAQCTSEELSTNGNGSGRNDNIESDSNSSETSHITKGQEDDSALIPIETDRSQSMGAGEKVMSRIVLEKSLSQVYQDLEEKRKQDLKALADVQKEIVAQAHHTCEVLEKQLTTMHETMGREMELKTRSLMAVLEKVKKAEIELQKSRSSLKGLCEDIHLEGQ